MAMDPTTVAAALLVFAIGGGLGFWLGTARQSRKVMQAGAIKAEYEEYRQQVTSHFGKAAEHFQTIGREYRALYEHMASGADALCAVRDANNKLSFVPGDGKPDVEASPVDADADDAEAAERASAAPADPDDAVREQAADGDDARDEAAPPTGAADRAANDDRPPADQDKVAADKPERTYH